MWIFIDGINERCLDILADNDWGTTPDARTE